MKHVLWIGESSFTIWHSESLVWLVPEECYLPECLIPTIKFGGGAIIVCGCFSGFGLGLLYLVKGDVIATLYNGYMYASNLVATVLGRSFPVPA